MESKAYKHIKTASFLQPCPPLAISDKSILHISMLWCICFSWLVQGSWLVYASWHTHGGPM